MTTDAALVHVLPGIRPCSLTVNPCTDVNAPPRIFVRIAMALRGSPPSVRVALSTVIQVGSGHWHQRGVIQMGGRHWHLRGVIQVGNDTGTCEASHRWAADTGTCEASYRWAGDTGTYEVRVKNSCLCALVSISCGRDCSREFLSTVIRDSKQHDISIIYMWLIEQICFLFNHLIEIRDEP